MKVLYALLGIVFFFPLSVFADIVTVGPNDEDYTTIGAALLAADTGDVVVVAPGTYYEQVTMKVGVTLKSVNWGSDGYNDFFGKSGRTIIDGGTSYPVVSLADNSRLEGFTITGGSASGFAVHGYFVNAEVIGNRIINNSGGGLYLLGSGLVHKNLIAGNAGNGLELAYSSASVHFNSIGDNTGDGIRIYESLGDHCYSVFVWRFIENEKEFCPVHISVDLSSLSNLVCSGVLLS